MINRTRRQFLQDSIFAAAAVSSAPMISSVAKAQSKSPNEKLLCAVVGCKGRGGGHISALSGRKDCAVAYIVDIDEKVGRDRCNSVEKRTGRRPRFVKDMREVFDDKSVDIVSTATPNHWHALCGVWAMQAGKDVFIEKPISHDIPEGAALVAAAKKYKRMCQVGCRPSGRYEVHRRRRYRRGQLCTGALLQAARIYRPAGRLSDPGRGRL
jgi:hypothetical protein